MLSEMENIFKTMKNKANATIITKVLKLTTDEETKQKLEAKLVKMVLELDCSLIIYILF